MEFHPLIPQMKYETNERTNEFERNISRVFDFSNSFKLYLNANMFGSRYANAESVNAFALDPMSVACACVHMFWWIRRVLNCY